MNKRLSYLLAASMPAVAVVLLLPGACEKKQPVVAAKPKSAIEVAIDPSNPRLPWTIRTSTAEFQLLPNGYIGAQLRVGSSLLSLDEPASRIELGADSVVSDDKDITDFALQSPPTVTEAEGKLGLSGKRLRYVSRSASTGLERTVTAEVYDNFPSMIVTSVSYKNSGLRSVSLSRVTTQRHLFDATITDPKAHSYEMWSFQGSSVDWGKDEVFPVPAKFSQENVMGEQVNQGHGGGIPVMAFWTNKIGVAIGHLETVPLVLAMPVRVTQSGKVEASISISDAPTLRPGEVFSTPRTFVMVYQGDYYEPLRTYSLALQKEGWPIPKPTSEDYNVSWCGWGYGFNVTPRQMTGTIPKLKQLGIKWATLDDRWFDSYGDWRPRPDTFPNESIKQMVDDFHRQGMKVQLWWLPLGVEDGVGGYEPHKYKLSDVVREHPDWLILDKDGHPARMIRDLAVLCPALPEVQDYYKKLTEKFIRDWGFDGHKLDNIYTVPACYNPKHHHKSPNDSIRAMGEVYGQIFQTTRSLKPESVTQSCPCGTVPSIAWLPYMDQAVTADPVGSVQARRRIKMYKAMLGPEAAVYGDHVELSQMNRIGKDGWLEHGRDFASTVGTGGVPGTKFTWPDKSAKNVALVPEKETLWKRWIGLYNQKMLSRGTFLNLYTIGYDNPEGYAIAKDGRMYYAFFARTANASRRGSVDLRGLEQGKYEVVDYVNGKKLGVVDAANPRLNVQFTGHLLLEVTKSQR